MIIFLDLDGTIRATKTGRPVPNFPGEQYILLHVKSRLLWEQNRGNKLVGISNQAGVAFGYLTEEMAFFLGRETSWLLGGMLSNFILDYRDPGDKAQLISAYLGAAKQKKAQLVGNEFADQRAAREAGIDFQWAHDFFDWPEGFVEETERGFYPADWLVKWREFKNVQKRSVPT